MRHFFITVIGTLTGIIIFFILLFILLVSIGVSAAVGTNKTPTAPTRVLTLDLRKPAIDHNPGESLFSDPRFSIVDTVQALNQAKTDKAVKGVFIRAENFGMAPASAEELRLALLDFKTSGKFVIAHAQGFEGTSLMSYQAVSAADEIWMQDTTSWAVAGLRSETEFYGGVFDFIDAEPQFIQFHEYKNAVNSYTKTDFTDEHREATESYLKSIFDNAVTQIAQDRELTPNALTQILQTAPHSAEAAQAAGLIDKLGYIETVTDDIRERVKDKDVQFLPITNYEITPATQQPMIAFIGGQGPVLPGESSNGSIFSPTLTMGGDTIAAGFEQAAKNKKVKAIIFRVSSPGGSPAASDQILAALERAREAGKPVIISMGQYAASGGYYVAAKADHIVALPQTLTGSIGVYGGKIAFEDSFAKIGYNIEGITVGGDYAGVYSIDTPFTESQRASYRAQLQDIYDDFTTRVSDGRALSIERVKEIAKGRVWTGAQAKEIGLVDELGGFAAAIEAAKTLAEIDADSKVYIKTFPKPKSTEEQFMELFSGSAQIWQDISTLREISALPEVKAVIAARQYPKMGQEVTANIPDIR